MTTRRELLVGAAGMTGLALLTGVGGSVRPIARNLVLVVADGGWDLTFTFDPKPGVDGVDGPYVDLNPQDRQDVEEIGTFGDIDVTLNARRRPGVTAFFERWADQVAVARGVWVGSVSHWIGRRRILSGTDDPRAPDMATIVGTAHADARPLGMVDLSNVGRLGEHSARAVRGGVRGQLGQLLQPSTRYPMADGSARPRLSTSDRDRDLIDAWMLQQSTLDAASRGYEVNRHLAQLERNEARRRARQLEDRAPQLDIPAPGQPSVQDLAGYAASLLATQTCAGVMIDSGPAWDTHVSHVLQHSNHDLVLSGVHTLLEELELAGVLQDTLVVVLSEMVRSPFRNPQGGTEHWPYTGVLFAGAGVAGGAVCGGTDDHLVGQPVDVDSGRVQSSGPVLSYDHVVAGILEHVGVDVEAWIPGAVPLRGFRTA